MSVSVNSVTIGGHLTRDPELRFAGDGTAVAGFAVAINSAFTKENGEKVESVLFVECSVFGPIAESMGTYLKKGSPVLVEGRLKQDQWDDKQSGAKRTALKVIARRVHFLGTKEQSEAASETAPADEGAGDPDWAVGAGQPAKDKPKAKVPVTRQRTAESRPAADPDDLPI
jgi:single-strand DNA-binding protein